MRSRLVLILGFGVGCGGAILGQDGILNTVAGTGEQGSTGDGGNASEASFDTILSIAIRSSDNSQLLVDVAANVVRRIDASGVINAFCGQNGTAGYDGDGGPASEALLSGPYDVVLDAQENVYIADQGNNVVRRVDATTGTITTIAGTGAAGYNGPSGIATQVQLNLPAGLAADADGNIYIADFSNGVVRKVDMSGNLSTVAGDFDQHGASTGDGGPATQAGMIGPGGLAVASDGSLYIAEVYGNRVRRVAPNGTISTFAGTGEAGYDGDGSAATSAKLHFDEDAGYSGKLELAPDGSLLIADTFNHAIRRVSDSGCIETFAGSGSAGYDGDGQWAFEGKLNSPYDIACQPNGDFIIADAYNNRLRQVDISLALPAGSGVTASLGDEVSVTFDGVNTGVEISIDVRDPNNPAIPDNLQVNGKYLDFDISSGTYVGTITLRIAYDATGLTLEEEQALRLLHYDGTQWVDVTVSVDTDADEIVGQVATLSPFAVALPLTEVPFDDFIRGDTNGDGTHDISDAVNILQYLFAGTAVTCRDSLDVDDSGLLEITDAIRLLSWLFLGGIAPLPPGPENTGSDPTDDQLGCKQYPR